MKSLNQKLAYYWFNQAFYGWYGDEPTKKTEEEWKEFENILDNSPYDRNLLQWIWDQVAELGDDGYSYEEFVSICGTYPGNYTDWQQSEYKGE